MESYGVGKLTRKLHVFAKDFLSLSLGTEVSIFLNISIRFLVPAQCSNFSDNKNFRLEYMCEKDPQKRGLNNVIDTFREHHGALRMWRNALNLRFDLCHILEGCRQISVSRKHTKRLKIVKIQNPHRFFQITEYPVEPSTFRKLSFRFGKSRKVTKRFRDVGSEKNLPNNEKNAFDCNWNGTRDATSSDAGRWVPARGREREREGKKGRQTHNRRRESFGKRIEMPEP